MRILIADNDSVSLTILKGIIEKCGYDVETAVNGMQAWQIMQQPVAPPIAILDLMEAALLEIARSSFVRQPLSRSMFQAQEHFFLYPMHVPVIS